MKNVLVHTRDTGHVLLSLHGQRSLHGDMVTVTGKMQSAAGAAQVTKYLQGTRQGH